MILRRTLEMTIGIQQFILVCPLVFLAGFVDAVAGGGGLISLPAYMIAGLPAHYAIATNKMSSSMGTTIATLRYAKLGYLPGRSCVFYLACGLLGSVCGARLALLMDDSAFKIFMLIVLPLTALYVMRSKGFSQDREPYSAGKTTVIAMLVASVIGVYDGFYGPGTGTFLLLFLTSLAHLRLQEANGVTKVINLTTNLTALVVYLRSGYVLLPLGLTAGLFNIAGNYLGADFFASGGVKAVKPIMLIVLVIFFIKIITEL